MRHRSYMITTLILALAMVAILGFAPATTDAQTPTVAQQGAPSKTEQPVVVSIEKIDLDVICVGNNTVTGVLKLSAEYKGSITLVVASHIPPAGDPGGTAEWNRTGGTVTVNFDNQSSATFSIPVTQVSGANSYRIEVQGATPAAGWSVNENSLNTKSDSFKCGEATKTPTPTATVVVTNTPTPTPTATVEITNTPTATPTATGTVVETTPTPTATAGSTPSSETGNIAVFKSMCNDIGQQDTCVQGHDTSLEGYHVDFQVRAGADASGPVLQTIIVTLGDNAGGGGNVANGGMGRSVGSALPVGTYTVCEVPVAYKTGYPNVPLQAFPRPTASQGGSTGGSNQRQTGDLCITVDLTPGTAELKFLDLRIQPPATPTATPTATGTVGTTPTSTPTPTSTAVEGTRTPTPTVTATGEATATPTPTTTGGGGGETPTSTPTATQTPAAPTSTATSTATPASPTATTTSNGGDNGNGGGNGNGGNGGNDQQAAPTATAIPAAAAGPGPSGEVAGAAPPPAPAQPAAPAAPTPEVAGFMPAPPPAPPAQPAPAVVPPSVLPAAPAAAPPAQVPAQIPAARTPQAQPAAPRVLPTTGEADPAAEWEIAALIGMMLSMGGIATMRRRGTQPR